MTQPGPKTLFRRAGGRSEAAGNAASSSPILEHGFGSASKVIANARENLNRARAHLNLPPLEPITGGATSTDGPVSGLPPDHAGLPPDSTQSQLQHDVDAEIKSVASHVGWEDTASNGNDKMSAISLLSRALGLLRSPQLAEVLQRGSTVADADSAENIMKSAQARAEAAEAKADAAEALAHGRMEELKESQLKIEELQQRLAEQGASGSGMGDIGSNVNENGAVQPQQTLETISPDPTENESLRQRTEVPSQSDETNNADSILIQWLSSGGTDLLVELGGLGAHEALIEHDCTVAQDVMLELARAPVQDEGLMPGTGMLHGDSPFLLSFLLYSDIFLIIFCDPFVSGLQSSCLRGP